MSPLLIQMSFDYGVDLEQKLLIRSIHLLHHFNDEILGYVVLHTYSLPTAKTLVRNPLML